MTNPPGVRVVSDGDADDALPDGWDASRAVRGLPPEVQPVARYLHARLSGEGDEGEPGPVPVVESLDVVVAAVRALRDTILEAAERGAAPAGVRFLHGRLDLAFASLVSELLARRSEDARGLLRDVSHDLRSPLNSVLFLADALASGHSGPLNDVQRRQVGVLYTAAVSLVGLLNDLIDVSRLGEGTAIEVASEPFSVEGVLRQVDQLVGPLATHAEIGLAFSLETLGPRIGDRRILTRLLINLVSNGVQAARPGDRVDVRVFENADGALRITVSDTGHGADVQELRASLAGRGDFPVAGGRDRGWTHGLGLAICSRLVRASSGEITVESAPGQGCRFTIDLPYPRG